MPIYKKNNKYYCRGSVNGERYNRLCDGATNTNEAKKLEDAIRYNIMLHQAGLAKETKSYTVQFMMSKYLLASKENSTYYKAELFSKRIIGFFSATRDISSIKSTDVLKFRMSIVESGKSYATANRHFSALKRAYNVLIKDGLINYNPTNGIKKLSESGRRNRYLSRDEWERLKKVMPDYLMAIVLTALQTGLRKQNVLRLRWEQVNLKSRTIELLKSENKGKKRIIKPITNTLYKLLMSLNPKTNGYVFVNPRTNKPYTDVKRSFKSALDKAGIEGVIFHDLRRTFGTWLLKEGVDLRTIQHLLDHEDIGTTQRYLSLSSKDSIEAVNKLDEFMS